MPDGLGRNIPRISPRVPSVSTAPQALLLEVQDFEGLAEKASDAH